MNSDESIPFRPVCDILEEWWSLLQLLSPKASKTGLANNSRDGWIRHNLLAEPPYINNGDHGIKIKAKILSGSY